MNDATRANLADFVEILARHGSSDPAIADRLGISVAQVRTIRRHHEIPPGERRWLGTQAEKNPSDTAGSSTDPRPAADGGA